MRVRVLGPMDSLGTAAEAVRGAACGAVPVVRHGMLLGLLSGPALTEALGRGENDAAGAMTVGSLPLEPVIAIPESFSPADALRFFQANGLLRAPVVDAVGGYVGMVSGADLATAVCGRLRPALIGGMATPFGVYLTGGGARGGVGDLALMATGAYMGVLFLLAIWLSEALLGSGGWAYRVPALAAWLDRSPALPRDVSMMVLYALFFRLSWVTGYHAAEHQVVHTLEAGDDLRPDVVRSKSRVHPRCGTNLVVAVMLMTAFWQAPWLERAGGPFLPMIVTFFLWRRIGGWVQQYVTTRPASPDQIESGIRAGRELLARYQSGAPRPGGVWRRVWNMGLLQVLAGWVVLIGALALLQLARLPLPEALRVY